VSEGKNEHSAYGQAAQYDYSFIYHEAPPYSLFASDSIIILSLHDSAK